LAVSKTTNDHEEASMTAYLISLSLAGLVMLHLSAPLEIDLSESSIIASPFFRQWSLKFVPDVA
jgi:hypothetical protein